MSRENKNWTEQEDHFLRHLREQRGIEKWGLIAQAMQQKFNSFAKSPKQCRERYQGHLSPEVRRDQWTPQEELALFRLHDQKGNRWVEIAKILGRTDNAVKNHYHSQLRKALRKINSLISINFKNEFKPFKNNIISKVLQTAEKRSDRSLKSESADPSTFLQLKNKLLGILYLDESLTETQTEELRQFVREVNQFSKTFKRPVGARTDATTDTMKNCKYKGKEIISLINENKAQKAWGERRSRPAEQSSCNSLEQASASVPQQNQDQPDGAADYGNPTVARAQMPFSKQPWSPIYFQYLPYNYILPQPSPTSFPTEASFPSVFSSYTPYQSFRTRQEENEVLSSLCGARQGNNYIRSYPYQPF